MKSYLSLVFLYSSIESIFMLPKSFILLRKLFTCFCAVATLLGFWYSSVLFGVSSYSFHKLSTTCCKSCSNFVFLTSSFIICSFKLSNVENWLWISFSVFTNFSFLAILSCFSSSTLVPLLVTSCLICSIWLLYSVIVCSNLVFSSVIANIFWFLFSILCSLFLISCEILSTISSIELSLSSKDVTDIFKFVISKFKSSIYFWLSLLFSANSSITLFNSSICCVSSCISASFCSFKSLFSSFCFSVCVTSSFNLASLFSKRVIFSSTATIFCFSVAYTISISCNSFSSFAVCSILSPIDDAYSSFSAVLSAICFSSFLSSFSRSSISLLLPKIFTVLVCRLPPEIEPLELIMSPFRVTILNEYLSFLASSIAVSISSTTTVRPNKLKIICSYSFLHFTKSEAIPITPSIFVSLSNFLPWTEAIGKNDALPKLFVLKYSIIFLASCSVDVTTFCNACPKHISIAVSYSFSTEIKFAKTPWIPLFKFESLSHATNKDLTVLLYPSFSFSVSIKNWCLACFILCVYVSFEISSSYCFSFCIFCSFAWTLFSRFSTAIFLFDSIS